MSKTGRGRRSSEQRISDRLARQKAVQSQRLHWSPWRLMDWLRGKR